MLNIIHKVPTGLLDVPIENFYEVIPAPSLLYIQGQKKQPLFISILLHGNEDTGLLAIQTLLRKYENQQLPRNLMIFIGNVEASRYHKRQLDHQPDYNRIWQAGTTPEHIMAQEVIDFVRSSSPFACIDVHNNTGLNPHYSAVNSFDDQTLQLATLFNRTVIYFDTPKGTITSAFANICPSVIIECGQRKQSYRTEYAVNFLDECLRMFHISDKPVSKHDIDLFQPAAKVKIPDHIEFGFGTGNGNITFVEGLDNYNFTELAPGTVFAKVNIRDSVYLEVWDNDGNEVGRKYFDLVNDEVRLKTTVMPSMLTIDYESIRKDCLCYFMERYSNSVNLKP
jgi:succinylglutamate desuccinylase